MSAGRLFRGVRSMRMLSSAVMSVPPSCAGRNLLAVQRNYQRLMTTSASAGTQKTSTSTMAKQKSGTVQDLLKSKGNKFYKCRKDDTVFHAIEEMVRHNIGSLVIVEPSGGGKYKPVGIITERDYMEKGIVLGRHAKETLVQDIMSRKGLISVTPDAQLFDCMELMTQNHIRHIPVVDDTKSLIGMISIGDVVREMVTAHRKEMAEMSAYVAGGY
mmetsp:Transcript_8998/g.39683  ORF Transcript_8998/g.39683 Transcript_8998/m.39683 type:complete len:215 (-) Transcript_8998:1372-2016(-)